MLTRGVFLLPSNESCSCLPCALVCQVMHEVVDAVMALDADSSVRAIVLTGSGKAFAAGADIKEMATLTQQEVRDDCCL